MRTDYTANLIQKGEERKRLTKQLVSLASKVSEQIANSVNLGTEVIVGIWWYKVIERRSNVGGYDYVGISECSDGPYYAITDEEPGSYFYLHNDFHAQINVASREQFLAFVNDLPEIIREFETEEEKIITALREGFEKLRKFAE